MCEIADWIIAGATVCGSLFVGFQLKTSKDIAQQEFENSMVKEYRELVNRLPAKALLSNGELSELECLQPIEYTTNEAAVMDCLITYIPAKIKLIDSSVKQRTARCC